MSHLASGMQSPNIPVALKSDGVMETPAQTSSSSPSKTPISSLQELCQQLGKTPQYDLMAMEGRAHQPQFVYRCTVGDVMHTGQGGSKKAAKHAAAEALLKALESVDGNNEITEAPISMKQTPAPEQTMQDMTASDSANPVGTLQELVVARGWRLPVYSLYAESGPAHKKEFIMCCTVESFKEFGSGTAKKNAKRSAALKMYSKILALPPDAEPRIDNEIKGKPVAFDILHNSNGEKIQIVPLDDSSRINVCQHVQQIAENTNFTIDYIDIESVTANGTFQCMALLTTQPALCVHGEGATVDEAHAHAAGNIIKMLRIFFMRMIKREGGKKNTADK